MTDGDIADSRVAGLPNSVNETVGETQPMLQQSSDWQGSDVGKPADATPSKEPTLKLERYGPGEAPLAPDATNLTNALKDSPVVDIATSMAALASIFG